jgi:hypothetical protein
LGLGDRIVKFLTCLATLGLAASLADAAAGISVRSAPPTSPPSGAPVVIELFTSEGCSSCPAADDILSELARAGVVDGVPIVVLSEHVDYWNRLGWTDPFSSSAMTARQAQYARSLSAEVYTPQMVVDGESEFIGNDGRAALDAIRRAAATKKAAVTAEITHAGNTLLVRATVAPGALEAVPDADVLVGLTEDGLASNVASGENKGRRLAHAAVTRHLQKAGRVKPAGAPVQISAKIPVDSAWSLQHARVVILLQTRGGSRLVGAWSGAVEPDRETRVEGR